MKGYYTINPEEPNVYHVLRYCPAGKRITKDDRRKAQLPITDRQPCEFCFRLAAEWLRDVLSTFGAPSI